MLDSLGFVVVVNIEVRVLEAGFKYSCAREVQEYVDGLFRGAISERTPAFIEVF